MKHAQHPWWSKYGASHRMYFDTPSLIGSCKTGWSWQSPHRFKTEDLSPLRFTFVNASSHTRKHEARAFMEAALPIDDLGIAARIRRAKGRAIRSQIKALRVTPDEENELL